MPGLAAGGRLESITQGQVLPTDSTPKAAVADNVWKDVTIRSRSTIGKAAESAPPPKTGFAQDSWRRTMDPSNAPGGSQMSNKWRQSQSQAPTQLTISNENGRRPQWIKTRNEEGKGLCVKSPYSKNSFSKGMVITLPFHVPNTNDQVKATDTALAITEHGPVYSKRRMAIVLWRHARDMICVPLYSFNGVGIAKLPQGIKNEYIEITEFGKAKGYDTQGVNPVMEAKMNYPFEKLSCVHASGSFRVSYQENVAYAGSLTEDSKQILVKVVDGLIEESKRERC